MYATLLLMERDYSFALLNSSLDIVAKTLATFTFFLLL